MSTSLTQPILRKPTAPVWFLSLTASAILLASVGPSALAQSEPEKPGPAKPAASDKKPTDKLPPFPVGPQEKKYAEKLGDGYKVRHTDHFFVMYETDETTLKEFIARIEATYKSVHRFAEGMGIKIDYPKEKLPVVFCATFDEFSRRAKDLGGIAATKDFAGLYFPGGNFSIFYDMSQSDYVKGETDRAQRLKDEAKAGKDPKERAAKSKEAQFILNRVDTFQERNNKSVVQHEVAHQLLHNFGVHKRDVSNPVWFVEGLATLFEPPPSNTGAGFNVVNQYRLWRLREADKGSAIVELKELVTQPMLLRGGGGSMDQGYAQAWGLTHYLAKTKKKEMGDYVALIKTRKPHAEIDETQELADFEKCFGKLDDSFKKKYVAYLRKLPYRPPR